MTFAYLETPKILWDSCRAKESLGGMFFSRLGGVELIFGVFVWQQKPSVSLGEGRRENEVRSGRTRQTHHPERASQAAAPPTHAGGFTALGKLLPPDLAQVQKVLLKLCEN